MSSFGGDLSHAGIRARVIADTHARYCEVKEPTLVGKIRFEDWFAQPAAKMPRVHPPPTGVAVVTRAKESQKGQLATGEGSM